MSKVTAVQLADCPAALQTAVRDKLAEGDGELRSVTVTESTLYQDKRIVSRQYRAIVNRLNLVSVLRCPDDGPLKDHVYINELIWGDILEIIRTAPEGSALAELRNALPERTGKLLSL